MTKAQAKRLVLWTTGCYLASTDTHGPVSEILSHDDQDRMEIGKRDLANELLTRSAIPFHATNEEAVGMVTGTVRLEDVLARIEESFG